MVLGEDSGKRPSWVHPACADCPAFLVPGAAGAPASTFAQEPYTGMPFRDGRWRMRRQSLSSATGSLASAWRGSRSRGASLMRRRLRKPLVRSGPPFVFGAMLRICAHRPWVALPRMPCDTAPQNIPPQNCAPWTFVWICCPQLPYHRGKSRKHSTNFCSTRGHICTHTHRDTHTHTPKDIRTHSHRKTHTHRVNHQTLDCKGFEPTEQETKIQGQSSVKFLVSQNPEP